MANPYHDAEGRFCSKGEMEQSIRDAAANNQLELYFRLRTDYENIVNKQVPVSADFLRKHLTSSTQNLPKEFIYYEEMVRGDKNEASFTQLCYTRDKVTFETKYNAAKELPNGLGLAILASIHKEEFNESPELTKELRESYAQYKEGLSEHENISYLKAFSSMENEEDIDTVLSNIPPTQFSENIYDRGSIIGRLSRNPALTYEQGRQLIVMSLTNSLRDARLLTVELSRHRLVKSKARVGTAWRNARHMMSHSAKRAPHDYEKELLSYYNHIHEMNIDLSSLSKHEINKYVSAQAAYDFFNPKQLEKAYKSAARKRNSDSGAKKKLKERRDLAAVYDLVTLRMYILHWAKENTHG